MKLHARTGRSMGTLTANRLVLQEAYDEVSITLQRVHDRGSRTESTWTMLSMPGII